MGCLCLAFRTFAIFKTTAARLKRNGRTMTWEIFPPSRDAGGVDNRVALTLDRVTHLYKHKYTNIQAQTTHYNTSNTFTQIRYIQVEWPLLLDRVPHLVTVGISPILCHPGPGSWKGKVPKLSKCSLLKFGFYFIQAKIHNDVAIVDDEYASARSGAGNIFHDALCSGEESRMHEVQKETGYFRTSHTTHSPTTPHSTLMHPS